MGETSRTGFLRRGNKREGISIGEGIAFFSLMIYIYIYIYMEEDAKFLVICELIEIKGEGTERSHRAGFFPDSLFVPAIRESLLI